MEKVYHDYQYHINSKLNQYTVNSNPARTVTFQDTINHNSIVIMENEKSKSITEILKIFFIEIQDLCCTHRLHSTILLLALFMTVYQFSYYKHSSCMALLSFNNLCLFNLIRVISHVCGLWSDRQPSTTNYSYGLVRLRVLVVFSGLVLMIMLALWTTKVMLMVWVFGMEGDLYYGCSSSGNALLVGLEVVAMTVVISITGSGGPLDSVVRTTAAAAASPLATLTLKFTKNYLPISWRWKVLDSLSWLRRGWVGGGGVCPIVVLSFCCWLMLAAHSATVALLDSIVGGGVVVWLCDAVAAIAQLLLTASYLHQPLLVTLRTLMQGVVFTSAGLQRCLHQAATIDGVLELRQARFWCLAPHCILHDTVEQQQQQRFGSSEVLCGSVVVRLQRDAEAASVLQHLRHCLEHHVQHLTLQVYKDEWLEPSSAAPAVSAPRSSHHQPTSPDITINNTASYQHHPTSRTSNLVSPPYTPHHLRHPVIQGAEVTASHSPHYVNICFPAITSNISSSLPSNNSNYLYPDGSPVRSFADRSPINIDSNVNIVNNSYDSITTKSICQNGASIQSYLLNAESINTNNFRNDLKRMESNSICNGIRPKHWEPSASTKSYSTNTQESFINLGDIHGHRSNDFISNRTNSSSNGVIVNTSMVSRADCAVLPRQQSSNVNLITVPTISSSRYSAGRTWNAKKYSIDIDDHSYVNIDYSKPI